MVSASQKLLQELNKNQRGKSISSSSGGLSASQRLLQSAGDKSINYHYISTKTIQPEPQLPEKPKDSWLSRSLSEGENLLKGILGKVIELRQRNIPQVDRTANYQIPQQPMVQQPQQPTPVQQIPFQLQQPQESMGSAIQNPNAEGWRTEIGKSIGNMQLLDPETFKNVLDEDTIKKINSGANIVTGNFVEGLTGGIIKPIGGEKPDTFAEKFAGTLAQAVGTVASLATIGGQIDSLLAGSTTVAKLFAKYPKLMKVAYPLVKEAATFTTYGQLDPDTENRLKKALQDIALSIPYTAAGFIIDPKISIPASGLLGGLMTKLEGGNNEDAFINAMVMSLLDAWSRRHGFGERITSEKAYKELKKNAYEVFNEFSDVKVNEKSSLEEIKKAYRKAALKVHPDKGGNPTDFMRLQTAYDIITGKVRGGIKFEKGTGKTTKQSKSMKLLEEVTGKTPPITGLGPEGPVSEGPKPPSKPTPPETSPSSPVVEHKYKDVSEDIPSVVHITQNKDSSLYDKYARIQDPLLFGFLKNEVGVLDNKKLDSIHLSPKDIKEDSHLKSEVPLKELITNSKNLAKAIERFNRIVTTPVDKLSLDELYDLKIAIDNAQRYTSKIPFTEVMKMDRELKERLNQISKPKFESENNKLYIHKIKDNAWAYKVDLNGLTIDWNYSPTEQQAWKDALKEAFSELDIAAFTDEILDKKRLEKIMDEKTAKELLDLAKKYKISIPEDVKKRLEVLSTSKTGENGALEKVDQRSVSTKIDEKMIEAGEKAKKIAQEAKDLIDFTSKISKLMAKDEYVRKLFNDAGVFYEIMGGKDVGGKKPLKDITYAFAHFYDKWKSPKKIEIPKKEEFFKIDGLPDKWKEVDIEEAIKVFKEGKEIRPVNELVLEMDGFTKDAVKKPVKSTDEIHNAGTSSFVVREPEAKKSKKISVINKSVRENSQQAIIKDGKITIVNRSGRKIVGKKTFDLLEWDKLEKSYGNKEYNKKKFLERLYGYDRQKMGDPFIDRILDAQRYAINDAYKKYKEEIDKTAIIKSEGEKNEKQPQPRSGELPRTESTTKKRSEEVGRKPSETVRRGPAQQPSEPRTGFGNGSSENEEQRQYDEKRIGKVTAKKINDQVRFTLQEKNYSTDPSSYTEDEIKLLEQYSGAGGKESAGEEGKGLLSEFYTPKPVVDRMWDIAKHYQSEIKSVLEPSAGTGIFLTRQKDFLKDKIKTAYEYQKESGTIAKILNPDADIKIGNGQDFDNPGNFETHNFEPVYDLIIGNPPYGKRASFMKGKGEEPRINRWEEYFIKRSLDSLREDGTLVFVVNSSFLNKSKSYAKVQMAKLGELVDAYRLPEGIFSTTAIGTDIVVFKKNKTNNDAEIEARLKKLENGNFFKDNPDKVLGEVKTRKNRFGKEEEYVVGDISNLEKIDSLLSKVKPVGPKPKTIPDKPVAPKRYFANTQGKFTEIPKATPLKDYKGIDLFVHKSVEGVISGKWTVTEGKTGLAVTFGNTRKEAIEKAKERIDSHGGIEPLKKLIDRQVKDLGLSPRYSREIVEEPKMEEKPKKKEVKLAKQVKYTKKRKASGRIEAIVKPRKGIEVVEHQIIEDKYNPASMKKRDTEILKTIKVDGSVDYKKEWQDSLNYMNGKWYHDFNYFAGDIYEKLEQLEKDKGKISKEQYEKQKKGLEEVLPPRVDITQVRFDPRDRFILTYTDKDGDSVAKMFRSWVLDQPREQFSTGVSSWDVNRYVAGERFSPGSKKIRGRIKKDAERLFNFFLREVLDKELQDKIIDDFNRTKNGYVEPDYSRVPLELREMAKNFRGKKFELNPVQRNGAARLSTKGVGLIAYGVGVGKTHTLLTATVANMQKGWTKRPLFIVPKSTLEQWIKTAEVMFPNYTIVNLGGLTKPDVTRLKNERGEPINWINDNELTFLTHDGLTRLALNEDEIKEAIQDLQDALMGTGGTKRSKEEQEQKILEIIGKAQSKAGNVKISDLGIDHIAVDEVHNFRKVFQGAKAEEEGKTRRYANVIGGTPSKRAQQLFLISQYIQKRNGNRNVFLASATPFENHATEVYNILSFMARDKLKKMGIYNINDFFSLFSNFEESLEKNTRGEWVNKEKMKSFKNVQQLQKLLREFVDYQEDKTAVKPNKVVYTPQLQMSEKQMENLDKIQEMLQKEEEIGGNTGAVLKATTYAVANSISPYFIKEWYPDLVDPDTLIKDSPKLKFAIELIKQVKNDKFLGKKGVFLYMGANGVDYMPHIRDYIIKKLKYKLEEVAFINGQTNNDEREAIKGAFNDGNIKVLIGGDPTKEGIDLQRNGFLTINVALGWNPTEPMQVEGRVWRQGNKLNKTPVIYPLIENSGDITIYGKFEEKSGRLNDLFSYAGQNFDVGDIDPAEKKIALMTDPKDKARLSIELERTKLEEELKIIEAEKAQLENIKEEIPRLKDNIKELTQAVKSKKSRWGGYDLDENDIASYKREIRTNKKKLKAYEEYLNRKKITDLDRAIRELEQKVQEKKVSEEQLNNLYQTKLEYYQKQAEEIAKNRKPMEESVGDIVKEFKDIRERTDEEIEALKKEKKRQLELEYKKQAEAKLAKQKPYQAAEGVSPIDKFEKREKLPKKEEVGPVKLEKEMLAIKDKYAKRIGQDYLPKGVDGVYYRNTKNIFAKSIGNVGVISHEIAHAIDAKDKITTNKNLPSEIKAALSKVYLTYYPTAKPDAEESVRLEEGLATFIHKYVEAPQQMSQEYPELIDTFFNKSSDFYNKKLADLVKDVDEVVRKYQAQDPLGKIGARIASDDTRVDKPSFMNLKEKLIYEVLDRVYPIESLARKAKLGGTKDASLWLRHYNGITSIIHNNLFGNKGYYVFTDEQNGWKKKYDYNWKDIIDKMHKENVVDDFQNYLVARRAHFDYQRLDKLQGLYEMAKDVYEGLKNADPDNNKPVDRDIISQLEEFYGIEYKVEDHAGIVKKMGQIMAEYEKDYQELKKVLDADQFDREIVDKAYEENKDRFKKLEEMYDNLVNEDLKLLHHESVQLIDKKTFNELNNREGYTSYKRLMYNEIIGEPEYQGAVKVGKQKVSSMIRRKGSQKQIVNPIFSAIHNHNEIVKKAMRQVVYNKIAELENAAATPDLFQAVELKRAVDNQGRVIYPQEKDRNIIMARKNYKRYPILVDSGVKQIIDSVVTHENVGDLVKLYVGLSRTFTAGTTGLYIPFSVVNFLRDQITAGVNSNNKFVPLYTPLKRSLELLRKKNKKAAQYMEEWLVLGGEHQLWAGWQKLTPDQLTRKVRKEKKGLEKFLDLADKVTDIAAWPSAKSEMMTRVSEYIDARERGKSQVEAMEDAGRVSAPFHHMGHWWGGKDFIKGLPFFNAVTQSLWQFGQSLHRNKRSRKAAAFAMSAIFISMLGTLLWLMKKASEEQKNHYKDLEPEQLTGYIWLPDPNGRDLASIPVPQEVGVLPAVLNMIIADKVLNDVNYSSKEYINALTSPLPDQLDITHPSKVVLSSIPQVFKPSMYVILNRKEWPRVKALVPESMQNLEPRYQKFDSTSKLASFLGDKLNVSPIKIDYLITGYLGRASGMVTGKGTRVFNPVSSLFRSYYFESGRRIQNFYEDFDKINKQYRSYQNGYLRPSKKSMIKEVYRKEMIGEEIKKELRDYRKIDIKKEPEKASKMRSKILFLMDRYHDGTYPTNFNRWANKRLLKRKVIR